MRKSTMLLTATAVMVALTGNLQAAGLAEAYGTCVEKFANHKLSATVMLLCTAAGGKLTDCKVLEAPTPANGFDKAALCVADALPIGSKTGQIKVPILFQPLK